MRRLSMVLAMAVALILCNHHTCHSRTVYSDGFISPCNTKLELTREQEEIDAGLRPAIRNGRPFPIAGLEGTYTHYPKEAYANDMYDITYLANLGLLEFLLEAQTAREFFNASIVCFKRFKGRIDSEAEVALDYLQAFFLFSEKAAELGEVAAKHNMTAAGYAGNKFDTISKEDILVSFTKYCNSLNDIIQDHKYAPSAYLMSEIAFRAGLLANNVEIKKMAYTQMRELAQILDMQNYPITHTLCLNLRHYTDFLSKQELKQLIQDCSSIILEIYDDGDVLTCRCLEDGYYVITNPDNQ